VIVFSITSQQYIGAIVRQFAGFGKHNMPEWFLTNSLHGVTVHPDKLL